MLFIIFAVFIFQLKIFFLKTIRINVIDISSDKIAGRNKNKNIISIGKVQYIQITKELMIERNLVSKIIIILRGNDTLFLFRMIACTKAPIRKVIDPKNKMSIINSDIGVGSCCNVYLTIFISFVSLVLWNLG